MGVGMFETGDVFLAGFRFGWFGLVGSEADHDGFFFFLSLASFGFWILPLFRIRSLAFGWENHQIGCTSSPIPTPTPLQPLRTPGKTPRQTLIKITQNILQNPTDVKFTRLKATNKGLVRNVLGVKGGREALVMVSLLVGARRKGGWEGSREGRDWVG